MKKTSPTLSTSEVAKRLQVTRAAVANWCRLGLLPGAFVEELVHGPVWHIPLADLETFKQPTPGRPPRTKNQEKPARVRTKKG